MRALSMCSIPGLLEQIVRPPMGGAGLTIYIQVYNSIFFFVFASVLYAAVSHAADGSHTDIANTVKDARTYPEVPSPARHIGTGVA